MAISGIQGGSFSVRRVDDGVSATSTITASRGLQQIFNTSTSAYIGNGDWSETANRLTGTLIVNGTSATPTATSWAYLDTNTGNFVDITGSETAFNIVSGALDITRNLDSSDFPTDSLNGMILTIRVEHTFTEGTRTGLNSFETVELRRSELTESSISYWIQKNSGPFFTAQDSSDKPFEGRVYIGGTEVTSGITYVWGLGSNTSFATTPTVTISRDDVATSATLSLRITHAEIGTNVLVEEFELFDLLDPISFSERIDSLVPSSSTATAIILPFQNGSPMSGLTTGNSEWRFRIFNSINGSQGTWDNTVTGSTRGSEVNGTTGNVFTAGYFQDDATTAATDNTDDFVYRTATESNVQGSNDGVELIVAASEIEDNGNSIRVEYDFRLISYNG